MSKTIETKHNVKETISGISTSNATQHIINERPGKISPNRSSFLFNLAGVRMALKIPVQTTTSPRIKMI